MTKEKRPADTLGRREIEICKALVDGSGSRNKELAARFGVTLGTIKNHIKSIFDKTGMGTRLELAMWVKNHPEIFEVE